MWIISNDRYKIGASISPRKLSVIFVTCNLVADCISIVDYDRINCNPKQLIAMNFSKKPLRDPAIFWIEPPCVYQVALHNKIAGVKNEFAFKLTPTIFAEIYRPQIFGPQHRTEPYGQFVLRLVFNNCVEMTALSHSQRECKIVKLIDFPINYTLIFFLCSLCHKKSD